MSFILGFIAGSALVAAWWGYAQAEQRRLLARIDAINFKAEQDYRATIDALVQRLEELGVDLPTVIDTPIGPQSGRRIRGTSDAEVIRRLLGEEK